MDLYVGKQIYTTKHFHNDDIGHYRCVVSGTLADLAIIDGKLVATFKWDSGAESTKEIAFGLNSWPCNLYENEDNAMQKILDDGERYTTKAQQR